MSVYTEKVIEQLLRKPDTFVKIRANKNIKNPKAASKAINKMLE